MHNFPVRQFGETKVISMSGSSPSQRIPNMFTQRLLWFPVQSGSTV